MFVKICKNVHKSVTFTVLKLYLIFFLMEKKVQGWWAESVSNIQISESCSFIYSFNKYLFEAHHALDFVLSIGP